MTLQGRGRDRLRVLVSAGWIGGAGGAERALYSTVRALDGADVDVVARRRLGGEWAQTPAHVNVMSNTSRRWWGAGHATGAKGAFVRHAANPVRRAVNGRYDVYLQFLAGASLATAARPRVRLLIPSGGNVTAELAERFDAVAMQAPDNVKLLPSHARRVLLPPPVFDLSPQSHEPAVDLPDAYALTVFNPYDRIKGTEDLRRAVESAPVPIVWCHSEATIRFDIPDELLNHPRICHVTDATPAQLRHLYERATAYVSFSRSEGFGWAAADALRYTPVVATRPIGLFSNEAAVQPGVVLIPESGVLDWDEVLAAGREPASRDLSILDGSTYRARLQQVVDALG